MFWDLSASAIIAKALYDRMMSVRPAKGAPKGPKGNPKGGKGDKGAKRQAEAAAAGLLFWFRFPFVFRKCIVPGEPVEKLLRTEPKGLGKAGGGKGAPYQFKGKCNKCGIWGHMAVNCPDMA